MTLSEGTKIKWTARLTMDGYDPKAIEDVLRKVEERGQEGVTLGYLRAMLTDYSSGRKAEGPKRGLERNTYDPGYWWREKMLGSLERRPPECPTCGWLHEEIEPHAELCWCGHPHPLPNLHARRVRVKDEA